MKNNITDNTKNTPTYVIGLILFIIIISYMLYITLFAKSNIQNNSTLLEIDNNVNIYEEYVDGAVITPYEIASYSTNIYDNDKNRIHNIKLACETLNGCIIEKGEEFSFNSTLGEMGKADGYKKATGFDSDGNKIKMYGGGICQISSTLYNAALIANLDITERHAHSRRVNYVPKDKDATVYSGGPDLRFINNTKANIVIYAKTDGNTVTISLMTEMQEISKPLM